MPSAKVLEQKKAVVADLAEKMGRAVSGVLVKYQGITVEDDTKLRAALRKAGVEYTVIILLSAVQLTKLVSEILRVSLKV